MVLRAGRLTAQSRVRKGRTHLLVHVRVHVNMYVRVRVYMYVCIYACIYAVRVYAPRRFCRWLQQLERPYLKGGSLIYRLTHVCTQGGKKYVCKYAHARASVDCGLALWLRQVPLRGLYTGVGSTFVKNVFSNVRRVATREKKKKQRVG